MQDKVCLVTGSTSGVGRATAEALAALGAQVVLLARDRTRGEAAAREIAARTGRRSVSVLLCDLADLSSVRSAALELSRRHPALHVLVEAAGIVAWRRELTTDGIERSFAVGCVGHHLLACLLEPSLRAGAPSRVVAVSGGPGTLAKVSLPVDDLPQRLQGYSPVAVLGQTMLAKVLATMELARHLEGSGVTCNVAYPGLVRSNLDRGLPPLLRLPLRLAQPFLSAMSPGVTLAASSEDLSATTGAFLVRGRPVPFAPRASRAEIDGLGRLLDRLTEPFVG
jgi:NAD(P)-dependent dehydrogenase (short-subunit alcohol dehydrogenase family)